jgi:hypothetical protein
MMYRLSCHHRLGKLAGLVNYRQTPMAESRIRWLSGPDNKFTVPHLPRRARDVRSSQAAGRSYVYRSIERQ